MSLSSAQFNLGRVIGPALAGLALLTHDYAVVFGINAASFGAVVVALVMVRLPKPVPPARCSGSAPDRRRRPGRHGRAGLPAAIGFIAVVALLASPFIALVPAMSGVVHHARRQHGWPPPLLVTAQGIGAVAGALALPSLAERFGRRAMLRTALFVLPVLLVAYGSGPHTLVVGRWPSSAWAPATSPCCRGSTRWSSSGPRPRSGGGCSAST